MFYKILFVLMGIITLGSVIYIIDENKRYHSHEDHGHQHLNESQDNHSHEDLGDKIHWTKEKITRANIHLQSAQPGYIQNMIRAPGHLLVHPNHIAYIIPKVKGTVKIIKKDQGESVEEGEVLAVLESKEMAEAKATYLAALKKFKLKEELLQREQSLKQISPEQDYLNAQTDLAEASISLELSKQKLNALGLNEYEINQIPHSSGTSLRLYELRAPFKGEVIQRDLTMGELIDDQHKAYTIVDVSQVLAEISINPIDFLHVKQGQEVEISSLNGERIATQIFYIEPTINEETRHAKAIVIIDNRSKQWTPGKFITAFIPTKAEAASIVIPKEALQKIKGLDYVFVFEQGSFLPREVKIGKMDEKNVEVISGLQKGEQYATTNAFLLKSELEKESAEHSHTH